MSDAIKLKVHEVDTPLIVTKDIHLTILEYSDIRKLCENYDPHVPNVHIDIKDINGVYYLCDQIFFPGGQSFKVGEPFNFGESERKVPMLERISVEARDDKVFSPKAKENKDLLIVELSEALDCSESITLEFISQTLDDIQLFDKKQQDYGPKNISEFGEHGVLVRMNDKIERLKNLSNKYNDNLCRGGTEETAISENIEDTWTDISVYGIIARLCRKGKWPK